ncbi:methyl-accepting chemotaxis protein [Paenibacillus sp. J23TS9]|uniref:methyl-accepting chemotaxis protein n=1 Tax=Paenibacillus sp. J23TS9 TaxID=2807193 RepID=UPI001B2EE169|nr:methyl-accepting chemotaxis protein [Paenibacillus sp. J23TS9]GIP28920.1 methyl-accepting chemotaxis protein [Paenibacillus sp. J23TS9]
MKFKQKLSLSFAAVLVITIIVGTIGWVQLSIANTSYRMLIDDRVAKMLLAKDLGRIAALEAENVRGYLLTGNEEHFTNYENNRKQFNKAESEVEALNKTGKGKEISDQLAELEQQYAVIVDEIAAYKKKNDVAAYTRLVEEKCAPMVRKMTAAAAELENYHQNQLDADLQKTREQEQKTKTVLGITVLLSLAVGIVMAYLMIRMISRPVALIARSAQQIAAGDLTGADMNIRQKDEIGGMARSFDEMKHHLKQLMLQIDRHAAEVVSASGELALGSEQTVLASQQITESMQEVSTAAENQMARMKENKASMEESASSLKRIAESASITVESAETVQQQSEKGLGLLEETVSQMQQIQSVMEESRAAVNDLGHRSHEIEKITLFIKEIADQTHLLSLNASIEAARAGEHGRGFAVVAGEVKKLADQVGMASEQIGGGIRNMVGNISKSVDAMQRGSDQLEKGAQSMQQTGQAFHQIYASIQTVAGQAQEVSASTEELSALTEQMLVSEEHMVELSSYIAGQSQSVAAVTEEQLATMEDISVSTGSMSGMAKGLQMEIRRFQYEDTRAGTKSS